MQQKHSQATHPIILSAKLSMGCPYVRSNVWMPYSLLAAVRLIGSGAVADAPTCHRS
ncbi:MAG TPA: hypothetical protein VH593_34020 [Ktedonobacteraceae bacterium]